MSSPAQNEHFGLVSDTYCMYINLLTWIIQRIIKVLLHQVLLSGTKSGGWAQFLTQGYLGNVCAPLTEAMI